MIGGRLCLDFVNTVPNRFQSDVDVWTDVEAYLAWAERAGALSGPEAREVRARGGSAEAPILNEARTFREQLYKLFVSRLHGRALPPAPLAHLERRLREAFARRELAPAPQGRAEWSWPPQALDVRTPLLRVALSAEEFLSEPASPRFKECLMPEGCGWLFVDETKNGSRKWCSMRTCGGAAKARRHYRRTKVA